MCGITGYVGGRGRSVRLVLDNLKRLEYRGYDSAGVAVVKPDAESVTVLKKKGKLANLEAAWTGWGSRAGRSSLTRAGRRTGGPTTSTRTPMWTARGGSR